MSVQFSCVRYEYNTVLYYLVELDSRLPWVRPHPIALSLAPRDNVLEMETTLESEIQLYCHGGCTYIAPTC